MSRRRRLIRIFSRIRRGAYNTIRQPAQEKRTMVIVTTKWLLCVRDVADRAIFMDQGQSLSRGRMKTCSPTLFKASGVPASSGEILVK